MINVNVINIRELDLKQARNGNPRVQSPFGYIKSLKIGGHELKHSITDAFTPKEKNKRSGKAVVLLSKFIWNGEQTGSIEIGGLISGGKDDTPHNQLTKIAQGEMEKHEVDFEFEIFRYATVVNNNGYHQHVWTKDGKCEGILWSNDNGGLSVSWDSEPAFGEEHWYDFQMVLKPKPHHENKVSYQPQPNVNSVLPWGNQ